MYDEIDPPDYRDSAGCRQILKKIEGIVEKKKKVKTRFINKKVTLPRGWSLVDIIEQSTVIAFQDGPRPEIVLRAS
jgi:hypothetical protein